MAHTCNPSTLGDRGRHICEFEESLDYRVSSRTAKSIQRNPVLKIWNLEENKTKQKKKEVQEFSSCSVPQGCCSSWSSIEVDSNRCAGKKMQAGKKSESSFHLYISLHQKVWLRLKLWTTTTGSGTWFFLGWPWTHCLSPLVLRECTTLALSIS